MVKSSDSIVGCNHKSLHRSQFSTQSTNTALLFADLNLKFSSAI